MSLLPAYFGARRKREEEDDLAPLREPDNDAREDVFNLIPPRAPDKPTRFEPAQFDSTQFDSTKFESTKFESTQLDTPEPEAPQDTPAPAEPSRNVHAIGAMDLSRMSIDNDGRLYWDGKPVEVRRRMMMSRAQIGGAVLIGIFVFISAIGAAVQGSAAAHDWACRIGWASSYCASPAPSGTPPARTDIPA
jgi:hypothetical protein